MQDVAVNAYLRMMNIIPDLEEILRFAHYDSGQDGCWQERQRTGWQCDGTAVRMSDSTTG
jgi:hypothetical protein